MRHILPLQRLPVTHTCIDLILSGGNQMSLHPQKWIWGRGWEGGGGMAHLFKYAKPWTIASSTEQ